MRHPDGRTINCGADGFGVIGAPAALVMRENCVTNARNNGFLPLNEFGGISSANADKGRASVTSNQYSGNVSLTLPDGWERSTPPAAYSSPIVYAKNPTYEAYLILSHADKSKIQDISAFAETRKSGQISKLRDASSSETVKTSINGRPAYVSEVVGNLPSNGVRYRFQITVVEGTKEILVLIVWATAANYEGSLKSKLSSISSGLNGL